LPGGAHCARDEPIWWVELKDRHTDDFSRVSPRPRQPARRPVAAPGRTDRRRCR
jgi:hypothetical protein